MGWDASGMITVRNWIGVVGMVEGNRERDGDGPVVGRLGGGCVAVGSCIEGVVGWTMSPSGMSGVEAGLGESKVDLGVLMLEPANPMQSNLIGSACSMVG